MKNFLKQNRVLLNHISILLITIFSVYIFFQYLFQFIAPFFIGWLFSLLFVPFVNFLEKKANIPRWIGSFLSILLFIGFFAVIVFGLWKKLYIEAQLFYQNLPFYIEDLQISIQKISNNVDNIVQHFPVDLRPYLASSLDAFLGVLPSIIQSGGSQSFNILKAILNIVMIIIVALISAYFFTKDKELISAFFRKHFHTLFEGQLKQAKEQLKYSILGYIKTQCILMFYTFAICIIGLLLLHSPYALLLSVMISFIDALPFFGSGFILWPGAVIYMIIGKPSIAVGYIIIYLCVNFMRQIMQPKILGTQIGLHPLLILISMYIGLKCIGFLGMIIGPILAVLLKAVYQASETVDVEKLLYQNKHK